MANSSSDGCSEEDEREDGYVMPMELQAKFWNRKSFIRFRKVIMAFIEEEK